MPTRPGVSPVGPQRSEGGAPCGHSAPSVNPGYTGCPAAARRRRRTLNEGRSVNPGYTGRAGWTDRSNNDAQRRPERQPRLHAHHPAVNSSVPIAQRRPERQPRLHRRTPRCLPLSRGPLNEGRSVNPGYTRTRPSATPRSRTLNEGWSVNPGYTRSVTPGSRSARFAQRRPERQPRLHLYCLRHRPNRRCSLNEGRSVNPGYTHVRDVGNLPRVDRSTKAGASTPATRKPVEKAL